MTVKKCVEIRETIIKIFNITIINSHCHFIFLFLCLSCVCVRIVVDFVATSQRVTATLLRYMK